MSNTPSETEIDNLLCKHWPAYSMQAVLVKMWLREAIESAIAKWAAPQPQAGAVPQGWKAVPVNPTPEMWKAAKSVPDPNPPYPPHYGLVWDAMLAASPTPPAEQQAPKETLGGVNGWRDISAAPKDGSRFVATGHNYGLYSEDRHACVAQWFRGCWMEASDWNETSELKYLTHWMPLPSPPDDVAAPAEQQAAQVIINFPQVGTAGPFPVVDGRVSLPDSTMQDLVRMLRPTYEAEQQAKLGAVYAELPKRRRQFLCTKCGSRECKVGTINEQHPPCECGYLGFAEDLDFNADEMRDFADRTHALRMQQAAPKAAPGELSADSLRHQNKLLAETLGACILASGIVRKDIDGFTGPELLHFGEDLRSMLEAAPQQEAQAASVQEDAARLDWLEQNLFHREKDEWDTKFGGYKEYNMWVLFSPKGIQGSARDIIDAAREQGADHDR